MILAQQDLLANQVNEVLQDHRDQVAHKERLGLLEHQVAPENVESVDQLDQLDHLEKLAHLAQLDQLDQPVQEVLLVRVVNVAPLEPQVG